MPNLDRYVDITSLHVEGDFLRVPTSDKDGDSITRYVGNNPDVIVPGYMAGQHINEIKSGAFSDTSVKSIVITRGVRDIEAGALSDCPFLTTVLVPDTVKEFNLDAVRNCPNLKIIDLESSKTAIVGDYKTDLPNVTIIQGGVNITSKYSTPPSLIPKAGLYFSDKDNSIYVGEDCDVVHSSAIANAVRNGGGDPADKNLTIVFLGNDTMIAGNFNNDIPFADVDKVSREELESIHDYKDQHENDVNISAENIR